MLVTLKNLKKAFILLFLLSFLYFNVGYYPFFIIKQQLIKREIKQKIKKNIPANELTVLLFDKSTFNSLKWMDKKEFSYNDNMYDVIKIETLKNDSIRILCIDDKKEKTLFTHLDKLTKTSEKNKQNKEVLLSTLHIKDYIPTKTMTFENFVQKPIRFITKKDHYKSYITEIPSPPPECC